MNEDPRPQGLNRPVEARPGLHVIWHWVIIIVLMTALIGGAAVLF